MTPQTDYEWEATIRVMHGLWKSRVEKFTDEESLSWRNTIGRYPSAWCIEALRRWHGQSKFFPKPSEIRFMLKEKRAQYGVTEVGNAKKRFEPPAYALDHDERQRIRDALEELTDDQEDAVWKSLTDEFPWAGAVMNLPYDNLGRVWWLYKHSKKLGLIGNEEVE